MLHGVNSTCFKEPLCMVDSMLCIVQNLAHMGA